MFRLFPKRIQKPSRSRYRKPRRRCIAEQLEDRRLLAAEGNPFNLPLQTIDTVGFVGAITGTVNWGDGTQTQVPLGNTSAPNTLRFRFDYSRDNNSFFTGARRTILEQVGTSVLQHFTDQLTAIAPNAPAGPNSWTAGFCHPSLGRSNFLCDPLTFANVSNMQVAANEIVVFAGARDYIGEIRGSGGPGSFAGSGQTAFLNTVSSRGQTGALANPETDFGSWGGSVSFDSNGTNWYFGSDINAIQTDQIDFRTVAAHELMHLLGFGFSPTDRTSSWERLTTGSTFNGTNARNAYVGSGFPPINTVATGDGPTKSHWDDSIATAGQLTLMRSEIAAGTRQTMTRLDLAALDDLGWQVTYPNTVAIQNLSHVYGDDGNYDISITVKAATIGEATRALVANTTNVAPTLTVPGTQAVTVGSVLSLPQSAFAIADPGFPTNGSVETFTYSINWKDGSALTTGTATITQTGNATRDTLAAFAASHTYASIGNYQVSVTVTDDDGGTTTKTFTVQVTGPPTLSLSLSKSTIAENDGANATVLTVTRSGPLKIINETVTLSSSDTTEASLAGSVVILAGQSFATVPVTAVDDQLLDGTQVVTLTASGTLLVSGTITLNVTDFETLVATVTAPTIVENQPGSVSLSVRRSNTDNAAALTVNVSGGNATELTMPNPLTINQNQPVVTIGLQPVNDTDPERTLRLTYTFTAAGYQSGTVSFDLLDDEPPLFQNPIDRFAVVPGSVTAGGALLIINQLRLRENNRDLDPETEQPNGIFLDVNGDYRVTALDALQVINEVRLRQDKRPIPEPEFITQSANLTLPIDQVIGKLEVDDDEFLALSLDPGRIF